MSEKNSKILVGLDVGTSKTCAVIGEMTEEGLDIIGMGSAVSKGIQKGAVTNIESAAQSIQDALEDVEVAINQEVTSVIMSISGTHIKGLNSNGVAAVKSPEVSDDDVARVLDSANAVAIPPDRQFLHVLAQEYILDGQQGIPDPRGMTGVRLEAKVHIVTCAVNSAQNLVKAVNKNEVAVSDIVLAPLAASEAVLTQDDREMGCVLVDIGAGTTDIAVWHKGVLVYTAVLDIAGNHITSDIAQGLQTNLQVAEKLKITSGCAMRDAVGADEAIQIPAVDGRDVRKFPRSVLADIIEPRLEEIFDLVNQKIVESGYRDSIPAGLVLTGGTALMSALPELCEKTFGLPVKRGLPRNIGGNIDQVTHPKFATAVGLLFHAINPPDIKSYGSPEAKQNGLIGKIINWFKQIV